MNDQNNKGKKYLHVLGRKLLDLIRLNPTWKIDSWEKKWLNLVKRDNKKNMELKDWNWGYKSWPLIISKIIRTSYILIRNPNPSQIFFWILFGILNDENSNPPKKLVSFSIYMAIPKWIIPSFGTQGGLLGF